MTVYDKLDWHLDAALSAGQPEENAFAHVGLYLGWLVRHDLAAEEFIRRDWSDAIKRGEMTGSDLSGAVDYVLAAEMLTPEGRAFTDYYYPSYLGDYGETFAELGEYGVADNAESFARIEAVLDRRHGEWVAAGRPGPAIKQGSLRDMPSEAVAALAGMSDDDLAAIRQQVESLLADVQAGSPPSSPMFMSPPPPSLADSPRGDELEQLAKAASVEPPSVLMSRSADLWGEPLLKRALKRLDVAPKAVTVTTALWSGPSVILYDVPNVDAGRLVDEFATVIHMPRGGQWQGTDVGGKGVRLARGKDFTVAYWAVDGLVMHVAVHDATQLAGLVSRLP